MNTRRPTGAAGEQANQPDPMQLPETGEEPDRPAAPVLGFIAVAVITAIAFALFGFAVGRASAAPRTAPASSGPWTLLEAPHGASPLPSPPAIGTRPAPTGDAPDLRTPPATSDIGTAAIGGQATWYCGGGSPCTAGFGPSDLIAAIDPTLGIERGERLTVHYRGRSVVVLVVDVCACPGGRIIDLSRLAFSQLADPSLGVIPVAIEFGGPGVTPPATDR
jgi:hypothetical protein